MANSVDPDQTPHYAASDLDLHICPTLSDPILKVITVSLKMKNFGLNEPQHKKTYPLTCAPNEDSSQPAYPRSETRVFVARVKKL